MKHVVISDPISDDGLFPLLDDEQVNIIRKNIQDVTDKRKIDAILLRSGTKVTRELIEDMPHLKIIARAGVGVDNIDLEAATENGVVVVNAPDGNTVSTAEHTFAMMLSMLRKIPQANLSIRNKEWNRKAFTGHELFGKKLGIIGFGRIGTELAKRALAFHMEVNVFDPYLTEERAEKLKVKSISLDVLLQSSDIITVHTPLNDETRGMIDKETLSMTKKGVFLINCARGGIIDEKALLDSLNTGHVAGAALDVHTEEPSKNRSLLEHPDVIATPHIAASTVEAQYEVARAVSEDVVDFLNGKPIRNALNYPTISKDTQDFILPFLTLSDHLGVFLSRCTLNPVSEIQIKYSGQLAEQDISLVSRSFLAGFLKSRVAQPVNIVNATIIAREREITYGETKSSGTSGYSNMVEVTVRGEGTSSSISGTILPGLGERVLSLNGFNIDFSPNGHLVFITHNDRPGVIGAVGKVLGEHFVNIATMHVGRKEQGGYAAMTLTFDAPLTEPALDSLRQIEEISTVSTISLL